MAPIGLDQPVSVNDFLSLGAARANGDSSFDALGYGAKTR